MKSKLYCYIKAIKDLIVYGVWVPHVYREIRREKAIIIATDNSFRVSENFNHGPDETVHKDACLIEYRCKHCGAVEYAWRRI